MSRSALTVLREHRVVYLQDVAYYMRNRVEYSLGPEQSTGGTTVPAVVFNNENSSLSLDTLERILNGFQNRDDVCIPAFFHGGVLLAQTPQPPEATPTLPEAVQQYLESHSSKLLFVSTSIPEGPYFLRGQEIHQAWRLYADEMRAFVTPVIPSDEGTSYKFQPLSAGAYSGRHPVLAVPSRLYGRPSSEKPLQGLRISIKDNYHLAGITTTLGSRSFTELYGEQQITSKFVQHLINFGATVVGKTILGAYAGSEVPPEKCIDYFPPWNPRGDGYQGPSGSSSGAGSSTASYDWLDASFGTDTTGSIRMPAASYGLWGLRTTWGSFPLEGIVTAVRPFDTIAVVARKSQILKQVLLSAAKTDVRVPNTVDHDDLAVSNDRREWPKKILYPTDWFPMKNEGQQKMIEAFLEALEQVLGVTHTKISLEEEWTRSGPSKLRDQTLEHYLDKSIYWPNYYDGAHNFDGFRKQYQAKFGREPYISPFMTKRWGLADDITKAQRDQGLAELKIYRDWILSHVISPDTPGEPEPIILLPVGRPGANYRDIVPPAGGEFNTSAFDPMDLCTVTGLPQLLVPIGQNPYESRVSGNTEYAPIVGSLAGVHGSDMMLVDIAQAALERAGWPTTSLTGRNVFAVGDNDRHATINAQTCYERL